MKPSASIRDGYSHLIIAGFGISLASAQTTIYSDNNGRDFYRVRN